MEVKDKVKQRRLERLRNLREKSESSTVSGSPVMPSRASDYGLPARHLSDVPLYVMDPDLRRRMEDPEYAWQQKLLMDTALNGRGHSADAERGLFTPPSPRKFAVKLFVSCVLFAALYGMFHLNQSWANKGKQFITASLTQSYDFSALSAWYTEQFGGSPSFIPSFNREGNEAVKVSTTKRTLFSPAKGSVIKSYDGTTHLGVQLDTVEFAPVYALDTGQVIFSAVAAETGLTVMIRHPGGLQSLYGGLSEAHVEVGDWMKVGEPIGKASKKDPVKGTLYFAVTKDGHPLNPSDVISFD